MNEHIKWSEREAERSRRKAEQGYTPCEFICVACLDVFSGETTYVALASYLEHVENKHEGPALALLTGPYMLGRIEAGGKPPGRTAHLMHDMLQYDLELYAKGEKPMVLDVGKYQDTWEALVDSKRMPALEPQLTLGEAYADGDEGDEDDNDDGDEDY